MSVAHTIAADTIEQRIVEVRGTISKVPIWHLKETNTTSISARSSRPSGNSSVPIQQENGGRSDIDSSYTKVYICIQ